MGDTAIVGNLSQINQLPDMVGTNAQKALKLRSVLNVNQPVNSTLN